MSDRCLIYSDLHIHNHGQDWRRVDDAIEVLDWIKQTALEREVTDIHFIGDFFHVRGYMYPSIVAKAYNKLLEFKDAGLNMSLLVGNHDMPYKNNTKHNCLTVFNSLFPVIEQPMLWDGNDWNFYFLPYVEDQMQLEWAISKIHDSIDESKQSLLFAHLDIYNAVYHGHARSISGVSPKFLSEKFDLVVTGHYHAHQQVRDNVWYVGSPYQQNFSEARQKKGIMLFEDGELEFIENTFSPQFLYLDPSEIDEKVEGNYIKILASSNDNIAALQEQAMKYNPRHVAVSISSQGNATDEKLIELKSSARDVKMLLKEWVDKHSNEDLYDRTKLLKTGYEIVESAKNDFQ